MADRERTEGEQMAVSAAQARGRARRPVEGIDERTGSVNPDGGSEQGGTAGPIGFFEGDGNEGEMAPLGGDPAKSAADGEANSQGGVASGAPG